MTGSSTTRILLITLLTCAIAALHLLTAPTLALAQEGTTIKDEGRIAYAQHTLDQRTTEERTVQPPQQTQEPERVHWLWVVGRNALMGGAVGGVLGTGAYLLTGFDSDPVIIAQFAGGGILLGASVGLIDVMFREDVFAQRPASLQWIARDTPKTVQFRLFETSF